jgi:hypothetical protein
MATGSMAGGDLRDEDLEALPPGVKIEFNVKAKQNNGSAATVAPSAPRVFGSWDMTPRERADHLAAMHAAPRMGG